VETSGSGRFSGAAAVRPDAIALPACDARQTGGDLSSGILPGLAARILEVEIPIDVAAGWLSDLQVPVRLQILREIPPVGRRSFQSPILNKAQPNESEIYGIMLRQRLARAEDAVSFLILVRLTIRK